MKNQNTFQNRNPKIKYLAIDLTKKVKDFYTENYKTLIKKTGDDSAKWKVRDFPGGTVVKNLSANTGHTGSSPGPGRSHMPRSN